MNLEIWIAVLIVATMPVAMVTDLSSRRIPNFLTFPLVVAAIATRIHFQGLPGIGLALTGAILAPVSLVVLHGGKRPGMGDLKLAVGVGAALGPITAVVSMLATALIGGALALVWMMRPGGLLADLVPACLPWVTARGKNSSDPESDPKPNHALETMPYGVAIGLGAMLIMAVRLWTDHDVWFL